MKRILTAFVVVALIGALPIIGFAKTECNGTITWTVNGGISDFFSVWIEHPAVTVLGGTNHNLGGIQKS